MKESHQTLQQKVTQKESLVQQLVQEQLEGLSLAHLAQKCWEMLPPELLTDHVCIDPDSPACDKLHERRFMLMSLLSDQVHVIIRQHDDRKAPSSEIMHIKEKMLSQKFVHVQLERAMHMFALMLSYEVVDNEAYQKDSDPTLHILLALGDAIMSQQYIQNWATDRKNMSLRGGDMQVLEHLRAYWDHIIKNLIYNMRIHPDMQKEIERIYKTMNYESVQIGQVFDALLLREKNIKIPLQSLRYYEINPEKARKLESSEHKKLMALVNHEKRYENLLRQDNTTSISVPGVHPHVVNNVLDQLVCMETNYKTAQDWLDHDRLFALRYEYISSRFRIGLVEIMDTFAPGHEELTDALKILYRGYGQTFQSTNDRSDFLPNDLFVRNKHAKDDADAHADHRNGMVTQVLYYLHRIIKEGKEGSVRGEIQQIIQSLGKNTDTAGDEVIKYPSQLHTATTLQDLLVIDPQHLGEIFMSTGIFLLMMQKNSAIRKSHVRGLEEIQEPLEEEVSGVGQTHKRTGLRLISLLTDPILKTPAHIVARKIQHDTGTPRKRILQKIAALRGSLAEEEIEEKTNIGLSLAHISPLQMDHAIVSEHIHKPPLVQLRIFFPLINEMSSSKERNGDIERNPTVFDFYKCILDEDRIDELSVVQRKKVLEHTQKYIEGALKNIRSNRESMGNVQKKENELRTAYAYVYTCLYGPEDVISLRDVRAILRSIESYLEGRFYEYEVFRELPEKVVIEECRRFVQALMKSLDQFEPACQSIIRHCNDLLEERTIEVKDLLSLTEAISIDRVVYHVIKLLYIGYTKTTSAADTDLAVNIRDKDIFDTLSIEEKCAGIYGLLKVLPERTTEIQPDVHEEISQVFADDKDHYNKQEQALIGEIQKYLDGIDPKTEQQYTKKNLLNAFFKRAGSYPTFIMGIQNVSAKSPEYIRYLVSIIHIWCPKSPEGRPDTMNSMGMLRDVLNYIASRDPTNDILYQRHKDVVQLLITLHETGNYPGDPWEKILRRSHPHVAGKGDGAGEEVQEINVVQDSYVQVDQSEDNSQQLYHDAAIADNYTKLINRRYPRYQELVKLMLTKISHILPGYEEIRLLDIGCGPGNVLLQINQTIKNSKIPYTIKGIDAAQSMINRCTQQFSQEPDVHIACENALDLTAADATYQVVTCNLMSHNIPKNQKQAFLERVYEALEPGGILFLTDLFYSDKRVEGMQNCIRGLEDHREEIEEMSQMHGTNFEGILDDILKKELRVDIFGGGLVSWAELKAFLEAAGFMNIQILAKTETNNIFISAQKANI